MKALTIRLSARELLDWARNLQWFYPPTMKLSTFISLKTDPVVFPTAHQAVELAVNHIGIGQTTLREIEPQDEVEYDLLDRVERPYSVRDYHGRRRSR